MASTYAFATPIPLTPLSVTSSTTITQTSGTDALMAGMTITPIAGTYLALFTAYINQNGAGQSAQTSFYIGGTQDASSVVDPAPFAGGTLTTGSASVPFFNMGVYTVTGTQTIEVRWRVSGGTGTAQTRKLQLVRVG